MRGTALLLFPTEGLCASLLPSAAQEENIRRGETSLKYPIGPALQLAWVQGTVPAQRHHGAAGCHFRRTQRLSRRENVAFDWTPWEHRGW